MNPTPQSKTPSRSPRQGGLVMLLAAMLLINLGVVAIVLSKGWFANLASESPTWGAQSEPATNVATAQPALDAPLVETAPNNTRDREADSDSTQAIPIPEPAPPARLAQATPEAEVRDTGDPRQAAPVEAEPVHEFFGIPFFE